MRQKKMIIAALAAMLLAIPAMVQSKKGEAAKRAQTLEVSFDYQRQAGPGSNQYAVWIENEKGNVVKTLFVTSYTTKGRARGGEQPKRGYIVRPACVPTWVKTVKASLGTSLTSKARLFSRGTIRLWSKPHCSLTVTSSTQAPSPQRTRKGISSLLRCSPRGMSSTRIW